MKYRPCLNCRAQTPRGLHCIRCDAGIFSRMALEAMDEDPLVRERLLDSIEKSVCSHHSGMLKHGQSSNEKAITKAALKIRTYLFRFDYEGQVDLFGAAFRSARMRTDDEIAGRKRKEKKSAAQMVAEAMSDNEFFTK